MLNSSQREEAMRRHIAGAASQRLPVIKAATPGQPIFLFDSDKRELHGPFAAEGPGSMNLDSQGMGGATNFSPRLPAQLRFAPVVRAFAPLPESAILDVINFDPGADAHGRRRPSHIVEASAVAQLLYIFVLKHHGLYESDDQTDAPDEPQHRPMTRAEEQHATRQVLAAEARAVREARAEAKGGGRGGGGGVGKGGRGLRG